MIKQLPIYKFKKREKREGFYYRDERLREYRNIDNPNDRISFDFVNNDDLMKASPAMTKYLMKRGIFKKI
jgi:hypothetical protein